MLMVLSPTAAFISTSTERFPLLKNTESPPFKPVLLVYRASKASLALPSTHPNTTDCPGGTSMAHPPSSSGEVELGSLICKIM